jgi:hypothetical protein
MIGLDWTPAVLDNFVTFISSSIFGGVFQTEFTSSHALHWQDHSFYTEGARPLADKKCLSETLP